MINDIANDMKSEVDQTIEVFKKQLASIRTGRAHVSLLDSVKVDYYGTPSALAQVASITVQDARTLVVKPYEKTLQKPIEKAILEANLGLGAVTDNDIVRVSVPLLTEERRREFCKQAKGKAEEAKLAVRNARREANEILKIALKDSGISEDDEKRGLKTVQDFTDKAVAVIDALVVKKEQEIMTV